jgi:hypothetical protein
MATVCKARTAQLAFPTQNDCACDLISSGRGSLGNGAGAGSDSLCEHWHAPPSERDPRWQQHASEAPQQPWRSAETPAPPPQQARRGCGSGVQRGHVAGAGAAFGGHLTTADGPRGLPQLQLVAGHDVHGTSMVANHTRTFELIASKYRILRATDRMPPRVREGEASPSAYSSDLESGLSLSFIHVGVHNGS